MSYRSSVCIRGRKRQNTRNKLVICTFPKELWMIQWGGVKISFSNLQRKHHIGKNPTWIGLVESMHSGLWCHSVSTWTPRTHYFVPSCIKQGRPLNCRGANSRFKHNLLGMKSRASFPAAPPIDLRKPEMNVGACFNHFALLFICLPCCEVFFIINKEPLLSSTLEKCATHTARLYFCIRMWPAVFAAVCYSSFLFAPHLLFTGVFHFILLFWREVSQFQTAHISSWH